MAVSRKNFWIRILLSAKRLFASAGATGTGYILILEAVAAESRATGT